MKALILPSSILFLLLISACATTGPAHPPLSPPEVAELIARLKDQRDRVSSYYSLGTVVLRKSVVESQEANILVVGTRDPFRLKVEITHPWGAPILQILVDRDRLEAFSFQDGILYTGPANQRTLGMFLPSAPKLACVWSLLRGYPQPPDRGTARADQGGRIVWAGEDKRAFRILELSEESLAPRRLVFLGSGLEVVFGEARDQGGILYSESVTFNPGNGNGHMKIKYERMVFNLEVPGQIFRIPKPKVYEEVQL